MNIIKVKFEQYSFWLLGLLSLETHHNLAKLIFKKQKKKSVRMCNIKHLLQNLSYSVCKATCELHAFPTSYQTLE